MSSELRLRANRANAARSTGPVTPEGKVHSSRNALRHGFLAKQILVGTETPAAFKVVFDLFVARWAPVDDVEMGMVEEMAAAYWRLRRAWAMETEMLETEMQNQPARRNLARLTAAFGLLAADPKLNLLHRYQTRLHVDQQRALHNLLLLRQAGITNEANNFFDPNKNIEMDASEIDDSAPKTRNSRPKSTVFTPKKPAKSARSRSLLPVPSEVEPSAVEPSDAA
jgi:hypothetical protein